MHDELFARALVLESGPDALAMVSVDLLALGAEFVEATATRIALRVPIPGQAILVAATHTHSGPVALRTFFNEEETPDPVYLEHLASAIEQAVVEAWRDRFTARLGAGACAVEGVGVNRRDPAAPIDREAAILRIDDAGGAVRGVLVQYGCHATLLGFDNLLITADYPGMAMAAIESSLGRGSFSLFFNGAEGNVSVHHSSELNAIGVPTPDRTFERAAEIGRKLASAVLAALPAIETHSSVGLEVLTQPLEFDGRIYPAGLDAALLAARRRTAVLATCGDEDSYRKARADELYLTISAANARLLAATGGRVPFPLQGILIGEVLFLAVPGELFTETSLELKRLLPRPVFVIGLANGYVGYIPTERTFAEGGYETSVALCAPDSERRLLEAAVELERRCTARLAAREVIR